MSRFLKYERSASSDNSSLFFIQICRKAEKLLSVGGDLNVQFEIKPRFEIPKDVPKHVAEKILDDDFATIEPTFQPPIRFTGSSCVYILRIPHFNGADFEEYYVGETDNFYNRLTSHRRKYGNNITAFVFQVADKSTAQILEEKVILDLERRNIRLISNTDGHRRRSLRKET